MRVLWRVIVKEFLQIRRDRKMIPVIFVAPIVQITVFGFAVNTDVTNVPTVLVDQDRSAASRDLVSRFVESGYFEVVGSDERETEVDRWLVTSRAQLGLVIGQGFGADLASARKAAVQVVVDGSDAASANIALGYASAVVRDYGTDVLERRLRAGGTGLAAVGQAELVPRVFYNPDLQEPLVLRARRPGHDPHGHDHAALRHGCRAREGDRDDGAAHRHPDPSVAAPRGQARCRSPSSASSRCSSSPPSPSSASACPCGGPSSCSWGSPALFILSTLGLGLLVSTLVQNQQQAMMGAVFAADDAR